MIEKDATNIFKIIVGTYPIFPGLPYCIDNSRVSKISIPFDRYFRRRRCNDYIIPFPGRGRNVRLFQ